jgi:endonuclease/exonuclease/phosphatase family metal-dependent hydrolase
MERPAHLVVASYNVHIGVDGWGRPFDVTAVCRDLDADVLVIQEDWSPTDGPGLAAAVGEELGYRVTRFAMAPGRRSRPHPTPGAAWGPPRGARPADRAMFLEGAIPQSARNRGSRRFQEGTEGSLGLALLSRIPVAEHQVIDLGRHPLDRCRRGALAARIELATGPVTVVGTHVPHPNKGALGVFAALRRRLGALDDPVALVGDMNLWGPAVLALMPGWHRAVRGATWPSPRAHSQIDHVMLRGPWASALGTVLPVTFSDHRPIRAVLTPRRGD